MTGHRSQRPALLLVLAALACIVPGCSGDKGDDAGAAATTPPANTAAADLKWKKVLPGGDCECADGSEFAFSGSAGPTRARSWSSSTAAATVSTPPRAHSPGSTTGGTANYDWSIWGEDPAQERGVFDLGRADNPFRDYSFIYVPSCTGDMHLGDITREYSPKPTVQHKGFVNGTTLTYLSENYPDATRVVVVGKSDGSIASPAYGGLAADLLPDAQITVFGAQSLSRHMI